MVKIALAGGSGAVCQEILDALVATKKHEILLLSRQAAPAEDQAAGVTWVQTSYQDSLELERILQGVHTVLSCILVHADRGNRCQKNLIDASVRAGVKRFAPSEWASSTFKHMHWYAGKGVIQKYLRDLNKDKKVLEYSLFQTGFFTNYLTYPEKSASHVVPVEGAFDFHNRRVIMVEGGDHDQFTLTTVQDVADVVARAVEYEGEWPVVGGIRGSQHTVEQIIAMGERIRGGRFDVKRIKAADLRAWKLKDSWRPEAVSDEQSVALATTLVSGVLLDMSIGALSVSDEWNRLLPDYEFTPAEVFLAKAWAGKP